MYSPNEENLVIDIEKMGITFEPKSIKHGEIVDTFDRKRRAQREKKKTESLDGETRGMLKKAKKTIKPGYKKKMGRVIKASNVKKRRTERRTQANTIKKANKASNKTK